MAADDAPPPCASCGRSFEPQSPCDDAGWLGIVGCAGILWCLGSGLFTAFYALASVFSVR